MVSSGAITRAIQSGSGARIRKTLSSVFNENETVGVVLHGDTNASITVSDRSVHVWNTTLTAARTATIATEDVAEGTEVRLSRPAAGEFNLTVNTSIVLAANQWADLVFDGDEWVVTARGSLATS